MDDFELAGVGGVSWLARIGNESWRGLNLEWIVV